MKTVLFANDGKIFENKNYSTDTKEVKITSIKDKLGCYVKFEEGVMFKYIFNAILKDKEFFDQVYSEELEGYSLTAFEKEWKKKADVSYQKEFNIKYLEFNKIYDYYQIDEVEEIESFTIVSAVGNLESQDMKYSITLVPVNGLKQMPVKFNDNVNIYAVANDDEKEEIINIIKAKTKMTIYQMIRAIIFEIAMFGGPEQKKEKTKEFLKNINAKTMIPSLKTRLEEAIKSENYEEAAELKRIIDQLTGK